ncbi:MAG TPA: transcriptional regulator, partial [Firmicutes bacterium]|nr:transcriptional regulator [Bacillota bacterium]
MTIAELGALQEAGAVASVCGSYVTKDGEIIENDVTKRTIGQTLKTIKNSKRIAIARGKGKADA